MSDKITIQGTLTITEPTFKKKGTHNNAEWKLYKFKHSKRTYSTFMYPATSGNWCNIENWVGQELFGTVEIEQRALADKSGTYPSRLFTPDESFLQTGTMPVEAKDVCDLEDSEKEPQKTAPQQPEKGKVEGSGSSKPNDLCTFALGSSARIVASMCQALEMTEENVAKAEKAWDKLYEFALAKLSDSQKSETPEPGDRAEEEDPKRPLSTITPEEKQKVDEATDTFKAEVIDKDQPVDTSGIKDRKKNNKELDIEVQIQDLEKKLKLIDSAKVNFRKACEQTSDYLKFLQSMAKGKGIKL